MGTYNIPRNVKGEGRILFIFSTKSLIYTGVGALIGLPFYFLFSVLKINIIGIIVTVFFALIGFSVATFKIPELAGLKFTQKIGGENIDSIIKRAIKFKKNGNKIYIYTKEEDNNG